MPDWTAFGAVAGFVLFLVLGLAHVTTATVSAERRERTPDPDDPADAHDADAGGSEVASSDGPPSTAGAGEDAARTDQRDAAATNGAGAQVGADAERAAATEPAGGEPGLPSISTPMLLGNVVVTHGVLAVVLVGAAAMTDVPDAALGVAPAPWSTGLPAVAGGVALGLGLAGANAAAAANLERFGLEYSEALRTSLAPDDAVGWGLLFAGVLPLVAAFEELLFRGVLIGAAAAGTGLSAWWFVVPSSVLFAAGHGLQGRGGVAVTGGLGAVLGAAFALTNSLLLVVVAHYVVNAVEFALHELLGVDPRTWLAV